MTIKHDDVDVKSSDVKAGDGDTDGPQSPQRRDFLGAARDATIAGVAVGAVGAPALLTPQDAQAIDIGPSSPQKRQIAAYRLRKKAARYHLNQPLPRHPDNGDESRYRNKIASYSKGLPHDDLGEVDLDAYNIYRRALATGNQRLYERIPTPGNITLRNPQNVYSFDLLGADSRALAIPPAPRFASPEAAGEMVELYWQAVTRDVPFEEYATHPLTIAAAEDLSELADFRGPKEGDAVTTRTLFRGLTPGDLVGPYISQFLLQEIPYGAIPVPSKMRTSVAGADFITTFDEWVAAQNGIVGSPRRFDETLRHIRNGRDIGEYAGRDFLYQPYLNAALILTRGNPRAPVDEGNPYNDITSQHAHNTFGAHHVYHLVVRVANIAQKHAWYQKWLVHRRNRPEAFAGRVHVHLTGQAQYPLHEDVLNSSVLNHLNATWGGYLLPQVYPVGVPPHPAYPAGHATIAGACATVLKAFFDESFVLPDPVVADRTGENLIPYTGGDELTVGGEINKLAANVSIGRDTAGVHWRSDSIEGLLLGEAVTISILRDLRETYYEDFDGFNLTKFDGTAVKV